MSTLAMSKAEREEFLAGTHVAIVSIAAPERRPERGPARGPARGPLSVPIWYRYERGGGVFFVTAARSRKAALIRAAGRLSLAVQTETLPYQYVTVEGPARLLGEPDREVDVRAVALRYLGPEMGEAYLAMTAAEHAPGMNVLVRVDPRPGGIDVGAALSGPDFRAPLTGARVAAAAARLPAAATARAAWCRTVTRGTRAVS